MAYGTIYTTQFYDYYQNLVVVSIQKNGYAGGSTALKSTELVLRYSNADFFDPIISLSADLNIVNNFDDFDTLSDLLKNHEKQYKALITRGGTLVFEGFMVCDVTEQQLYKNGIISITFTDYLKRLSDTEFVGVELGVEYTLLELLQMALAFTGLSYPIYINCRLFPWKGWGSTIMSTNTPGHTLFEQVTADADIFYSSVDKPISPYEVLESILKTFHCRIYAYQGAWYIERYPELLDSSTGWTLFAAGSSTPGLISNLRQSYTKQSTHFKYTNLTQVRSYISGLKTFEIELEDTEYDSQVYNNWPATLASDLVPYNFDSSTIQLRKWYAENGCAFPYNAKTGYYDIDKAMCFISYTENYGIYHKFKVSWNSAAVSGDIPTNIQVSWKYKVEDSIAAYDEYIIYGRYFLMVAKNDVHLVDKFIEPSGDTYTYSTVYPVNGSTRIFEIEVYKKDVKNKTIEFTHSIDLTDAVVNRRGDLTQEFVLVILPIGYKVATAPDDAIDNFKYIGTSGPTWVGDFVVKVNGELQDNNIQATIVDDFVKKQPLSLVLFDTHNLNLKNGLYIDGDRTRYWQDDLAFDPSEPAYTVHDLVYFLIRSVTRYSSKTRSKLTASILTNIMMRPLCTLYDTDIKESGSNVPFILNNYSFDLVSCISSISADEYGQEPIIID